VYPLQELIVYQPFGEQFMNDGQLKRHVIAWLHGSPFFRGVRDGADVRLDRNDMHDDRWTPAEGKGRCLIGNVADQLPNDDAVLHALPSLVLLHRQRLERVRRLVGGQFPTQPSRSTRSFAEWGNESRLTTRLENEGSPCAASPSDRYFFRMQLLA
jgi:hypothetical protein